MDLQLWPNLIAMFRQQAINRGDNPFLWDKHEGAFQSLSWRDVHDTVTCLGAYLRQAGLERGDRAIILAHNSCHWAMADLAIMAAGGISVPVYTTNTAEDHAHILRDSGATMAFVVGEALADRFFSAAANAGELRRIITVGIDTAGTGFGTGSTELTTWDDAVAAGKGDPLDLQEAANAIQKDDLACLIYTSGTGGEPKGVMLSHRAVMANCVGATEILRELGLDREVFLSFLPLSHAYEHTAGLMFPISIGAEIYFTQRVDTLVADLQVARPTIMTAVPRLYETMRERILSGIRRQSGLRPKLFWKAVELGSKRYEAPDSLSMGDRLLDGIVDRLVRGKVRARFGGRLKALVSGGAPLNYDVGLFFTALGLRLLQGYGQTEAAPVISCNPSARIKLRTVGPPLMGVELRIADDGEILVRGPCLMDGYWNLPDLSAEVLRDGWLHTGDIGVIDNDGYLQITDRKKDIIVDSGGNTISPQHVEGILALEPEIVSAMAIGDGQPHLVAVIVPSEEFVESWTKARGVESDLSVLAHDKAFHHDLSQVVERANANLSVIERIKRFAVADQPFTVDNGMMTPTMKPRRHEIMKRYGDSIEALY